MAVLEQKFCDHTSAISFLDLYEYCTDLSSNLIRTRPTRQFFVDRFDGMKDFTSLAEIYDLWKNQTEYLVIRQNSRKVLFNSYEHVAKVFAVKSSKRGNDVYVKLRIQKKLAGLSNIETLVKQGSVHASFLTLTCASKANNQSRTRAWEGLSLKWNKFINRIRKQVPSFIGFFRVYESTSEGYPHIHALLFFSTPKYLDKEVMDQHWGAWTWIEKCKDVGASIGYLVKYLAKGFTSKESMQTPAILWLLNKRSYGVSKSLFHLIQIMHKNSGRQLTLEKKLDWTENFELVGVISQKILQEMAADCGSRLKFGGWYHVLDFDPGGVED